MREVATALLAVVVMSTIRAFEHHDLNPCRLMCHMEHTIDQCKLVSTTASDCTNFYWSDSTKTQTVIDRVAEDDYVPISSRETLDILSVGKNGCEKLCEDQPECIDIGSECKVNGVCLNLFWNRGNPARANMTSCYQLAEVGCDDGTPILCGTASDKLEATLGPSDSSSSDEPADKVTMAAQDNKKVSKSSSIESLIPLTPLLVIPFFTRWA